LAWNFYENFAPTNQLQGKPFFDVGNMRMTGVGETLGGGFEIGIQATREKAMHFHRGIELLIPGRATGYELFAAIRSPRELKS
jgi:hypothetical protein